ncbi:hypothetical protein MHC_00440 [Mycoplasma haemocanis str. Illinois]|uniref:Uncharacterized protein n=1 Tax=Mycoplasma haemocanis (strain Illinois) TaxID=1111676 RepID=H6N5J4_MYCHN|nr:hypothetical protein [Mycoplasma haemocanis]AEW44954.1 hypothetical protein MHC_00440 [Mycoplasma haemocanis str. Illinois]
MFLRIDGTLKVGAAVLIGGFSVAFSFLSNNPYISSSVNRFVGNSSLVGYSEEPRLEENYAPIALNSVEDIRKYAESQGCQFVTEGVDESQVVQEIQQRFIYFCKNGKTIKLTSNELPKLKSNESFDPKTKTIRRQCSMGEMWRRWFGARLSCLSAREKWKLDRDPASYSEYFRRKGTYYFIVRDTD